MKMQRIANPYRVSCFHKLFNQPSEEGLSEFMNPIIAVEKRFLKGLLGVHKRRKKGLLYVAFSSTFKKLIKLRIFLSVYQ